MVLHLSKVGSWWQQAQLGTSDIIHPGSSPQLLLEDPKPFTGQVGYIIPSVSSGSAPGSLPGWTCLEKLHREAPRRHPNQIPKPPQLALFDAKEQWLYFELPPDVQSPHPISKAEPSHPTEETHYSHSYPLSHPFSHDPQLMTIGEGWNIDGLIN